MTDFAHYSFFSFANSRLPENFSRMAEPELAQWAEQKTVGSKSDTPLVRLGAILFWVVVALLLLARIFLVDSDKLRPAASTAGATSSVFHLTSGAKP